MKVNLKTGQSKHIITDNFQTFLYFNQFTNFAQHFKKYFL